MLISSVIKNHKAIISRLRMLRRYKGDPRNPNIIHLAVTDNCNMACPFCLYKNDKKNFKVIETAKAWSLIKEINSPVILLSGGEPLLGGKILEATREITGLCRDAGKITCILTNGITLRNVIEKDFPEFRPGSKFMFQISLDGLKEDHDKLRGHFDLIVKNMQFAKEAGHLIYTNTVIGSSNIDSLREIVSFIAGLSNRIYLNPIVNSENGLDEAGLKKIGDFITENQDIMLGNSVNFGKFLKGEKNLKCMFHSLISITPSGKLKFPCYCYGEGSEYIDSFSEYLEKVDEFQEYFEDRLAPQCKNCYVHCLHEADVYAHYYLNELFEQMKRPVCVYKKYIAPIYKRNS